MLNRIVSIQHLTKTFNEDGLFVTLFDHDCSNIPNAEFRYLYRDLIRAKENIDAFLEENCNNQGD